MSGRARALREPDGTGAFPAQDGSELNESLPPLPGLPDVVVLWRDASCKATHTSQNADPGRAPVPEQLAAALLHRIPLSMGVPSNGEAAPGRRPLPRPGLPPVLPALDADGLAGALGHDEAAPAKSQQPGFRQEERARAVLWGLKSSAGSLLMSVGSCIKW